MGYLNSGLRFQITDFQCKVHVTMTLAEDTLDGSQLIERKVVKFNLQAMQP